MRKRSLAVIMCLATFRASIVFAQSGDLDALLAEPQAVPATRGAESPESEEVPPTTPRERPEPEPADEAQDRRVVEEIVVTAQKREQTLREVPISVSVLDAETLRLESITDLRDASRLVPNANIDSNGFFIDVRIRGFGVGEGNKGFEQVVGLVVDGVPYGRGEYFQAALFDLERLEVLRGPQGTLFGKNNSAGLFNIVTRNPTDELTGSIGVELGELDRRRIEAGIGGPLVANVLEVRVAALLDERDGFIRNTTARFVPEANERMNGRERQAFRIKLRMPDLLGANLLVGYERLDAEMPGAGSEISGVTEGMRGLLTQYDPDVDTDPENFLGSIDYPELATRTIDTLTGQASYELAGWGIDAIGGYSVLRNQSSIDGDFTPVPALVLEASDDNSQTTFELRVTSPDLPNPFGLEHLFDVDLGAIDFTAGFFFQNRRLDDSDTRIRIHTAGLAQMLAVSTAPEAGVVAGLLPSLTPGDLDTSAAVEENTMFFEQTSDAVAAFSQTNWRFVDRWSLLGGLRFSHERKKAFLDRQTTQGTGAVFQTVAGWETFTTSLSRSETEVSPKLALTHDLTDDLTVFASWAVGFRAGGFNELASNDRQGLTFDSERASSWELGTTARLLDGAARLNLGLFRMTLTDFQVRTNLPGTEIQIVENAGEALAQGVEADATWLPTSWLSLTASLGFNDSEFLEFPFGACPPGEEDTDGDGDPRCDLSGEPLFRTPKWMINLGPLVRLPVQTVPGLARFLPAALAALDLTGGTSLEYQDTKFVGINYGPHVREAPLLRWDGSVGIAHPGQGWSLRVVAENLTNEVSAVRRGEIPFVSDNFFQVAQSPRLVFGELHWSF